MLVALSILIFPVVRSLPELVFGAAVVAVAVVNWPGRERSPSPRVILQGNALVALSAWIIYRVVPPWGTGPDRLLYPVTAQDYLALVWAVYLLSWHRFTRRDVRLILWAVVATTIFQVVMVTAQVQLGWHFAIQWHPFGISLVDLQVLPVPVGRATGAMRTANLLAMSAFFGIVAAGTLLWVERPFRPGRWWARAVLIVALVGATWALYHSGSRITWLTAVLLLASAAVAMSPRVRVALVTTMLVIGVLVGMSATEQGPATVAARRVVPEVVWGRLAGSASVPLSPLSWRLHVWDCGLDIVRARPLVGTGLGRLGPECESRLAQASGRPVERGALNHAHNIELQMAAELGVPFTLAVATWFIWVWGRSPTRRGGDRSPWRRGMRLDDAAGTRASKEVIGMAALVIGTLLISQINLVLLHDYEVLAVFAVGVAVSATGVRSPRPAQGTSDEV